MKVDGSLKSLIQGVSQQPPRTRLPGQCTAQDNMSSNPVDGLSRRPPSEFLATLFDGTDESPIFADVDYGGSKFNVVVLDNNIRVFDLEGNEATVNETGDALDYLSGVSDIALVTLDNLTYIANKETVIGFQETTPGTPDVAPFINYNSIVYLLGGQYARAFTVTVNWNDALTPFTARTVSFTHTTPDGDVSTEADDIATDVIAEALRAGLAAISTNSFNSLFTITRSSDVLYINWTSGSRKDKFEVLVSDGDGGANIFAINNKVTDTSKLPRYAPHGYHVTVTGSGQASQDDWYLEFSVSPDAQGNTPALGAGFGKDGIWVETVKDNTPYLLDQETMPHILEYDADSGEFTFRQGAWKGRQVGDEDSNEDPSFVGKTVEDMNYFQGRLVILSGAAVVLSRTNRADDFWIESATEQVDSDAIDVESTAEGVSKMLRAIPHNRDLVIFADGGQFIIFGRNALTPDNTALVLTTSFEANLDAAPVAGGKNVFFAINYGSFTGIREFFTEGAADINDSRPITQHVLKYLEGSVSRMASSSNFDVLLVQTDDPTILYVYEYIWAGDTKVQSSWSRWLMPYPVHYFFFDESIINVIYKIGENYVLEKLDLDTQDDTDMEYQVKLDRKIYVESVNETITDLYEDMPDDPEDVIFVQGEGCPHPGLIVEVDSYDEGDNEYTLKKDMDGGTVIAGIPYRSSYKPTMPQVKDADGVKMGTGTLVISKFFVNTRKSGKMKSKVTSRFRPDTDMEFSGRTIGDPSTVIGEAAISDNRFVIPIRDNADRAELELYTDGHEPLTILDIEWLGDYKKRGKRISQGEK